MTRKKVSYPGFVCKVSALLYQIFRLELAGIPNEISWEKRSVQMADLDGKGIAQLHNVWFHWPGLHIKAEAYDCADGSVTLVGVSVELRCDWNGRASDRNSHDFGQLLRLIRGGTVDTINVDAVIHHSAKSAKVRSRYPKESKPPRIVELNIPEQNVRDALAQVDLGSDWRL